jgi:plastocyanin
MEGRETQARRSVGRRGFVRARRLGLGTASAAVVAASLLAAPAGAVDATVTATAMNTFTPEDVTINEGEMVTWNNVGGGNHNVVFDNGIFTGPADASTTDWSVSHTFDDPGGPFTYRCSIHGNMTGTVTVDATAPPPGGGTPPPGGGNPPPTGGNPPGGGSGGGGGGSQPGSPSPGAPGAGKSSSAVTLKVSDATPARGQRVRFFGTVRPAQDGRRVQLQRRTGGGSYRTVARIKLTDAGASRSKFSKRLRMLKDAVFRARLPADKAHAASTSRRKRVNVH